MNNAFLRKFNELTSDAFSYFKVSQINVNVAEKSVEVVLLYPADKREEVEQNHDLICKNVLKASKIKAKPIITLKASVFDFEYCKRLLFEFFRNYPTVVPFIKQDNFSFEKLENKVNVFLDLEESASEYCDERNVKKEVESFLEMYFTDKISFETRPLIGDNSIEKSLEQFDNSVPEYFMEFEGGRFITPENVEEFIGKIVYDKAMYIEDCNPAMAEQTITVCGNIRSLKEVERAEGKSSFLRFNVEDYTSTITCLLFPTKYNPIDKLRLLVEGKTVVVKGQLSVKEFRGQQSMSIFVRNLSLCTMPQKFEKNEIIRKVANSYQTVFPVAYTEEKQSYLFEEVVEEEIAPSLIGKTFVAFDFETTGLDTRLCKITEIGAVKIVNGKIKETFSTLINPEEPLTEIVKAKTHITDEMLLDKPLIEDVIADFHKFCDGCVLVGQNSNDFDMKILTRIASSMKFKFSEEHEDTMLIARSNLKLRNYQLGTIAKYFGVVNENAHRALDDAITTAKIFIKLAKFI